MAIEQLQKSSFLGEPVDFIAQANDGADSVSASQGKRLVYVAGGVVAVVALSFWHLGLAAVTGAVAFTWALAGRS